VPGTDLVTVIASGGPRYAAGRGWLHGAGPDARAAALAVVPIPSLTSHEAFDSGVVLGAVPAARLLDHGRQAYAAARRVETIENVTALEVLRERSTQI
jgi:hypothetical protein